MLLMVIVGYCCCGGGVEGRLSRTRSTANDARSKYKVFMKAKGGILKVLFSYYQVMSMLPFVLDLSFPPVFRQISNLFGSVVNLNFIALMPIGCITSSDFHHQMVVYTSVPFITGLFMIIAYSILKRNSTTISLSNEIFASFFLMTFLILPSPPNDDLEAWKRWEKVNSVSEDEALEFALYIRSKYGEEHPSMTRISFLYAMYEPQCYDLEIVVSIFVCLGSIRTYAFYNPFVDPKTYILAEIAQWSLFFVMFGALLFQLDMDGESLQDQGYFDVILVGVNLTPLLLPVIRQLAIMKTLKRVEVLSTVISQVGACFGLGGDVVAAK
ncbi:hypothetical protein TrLO_g3979 [Triparma laevis f. longispina]|uniref:Uncharacterized protein n=1 Tax=Triparma laevis f. longispina TaxID=1714387 RepID=A0A9W7DMN0_9STRA|nr:hypothetical protein TrLO_g3979 [Triparma laevis f. longispina]